MNLDRIMYLEDEIEKHNKLYWENSNPEISDVDYDKLVEELREIDPDHELVNQVNSPNVSSSGKVKFEKEMTSLGKEYALPPFLKWASKVARIPNEVFYLNLKFDGCSGLQKDFILATKGDGIEGENVSNKIPILKILKNGEFISASDFKGECRGEILILKSDFQKYKHKLLRKNGESYKNERNASSALLATDRIDPSIGEVLTLVDFENDMLELTYTELLAFDWDTYIHNAQHESDFPADGIVLTLKDKDYFEELGYTSHHPRGAMAMKFTNPSAESVLRDIEWSVGKYAITPVGKIDPVEISGVTVTNVNLHNWKNIVDRGLRYHDIVTIERAGDVIPYLSKIIETDTLNSYIVYPNECPVCYSETEYKEPEIICPNPECAGKLEVKLFDAVTRIGIDGLGRPTIRKMIQSLNVRSLADILGLVKKDIIQLDGFAKGSTDKLFNELQRVKSEGVDEWQILASLNLKGIGKTLSKKLLSEGRNLKWLQDSAQYELEQLADMGEIRASVLYFGLIEEKDYIDTLLSILSVKEAFKGTQMKICMTGSFPKKKGIYAKDLAQYGVEACSSMSKAISYCIQNSKKSSGKSNKADKYGIPVVSIEEFYNIIEKEIP